MKKITAIVLVFAVIFCFAACSKKGEKYEPPVTEVVEFENGVTAVYEVVTEENGEVATDEEGETKYVPYVPPVTQKGGYLVTDAKGSTIPSVPTSSASKATTSAKVNVDTDIENIDEPTKNSGTTQKPAGTTAKPGETANQGAAVKPGDTTAKPADTTKPATTTKPTQAPTTTEAATKEIDGAISKEKAQKLVDMLENIENPFDEDLSSADFYAAQKSLDTYIANVNAAITEIKADKTLYQFVGNESLDNWAKYMAETKDMYTKFMTMVKHEEGNKEKNPLYYQAYTDFQDSYIKALEVYYHILNAAQSKA